MTKNERAFPGWTSIALCAIQSFAEKNTAGFTAKDVRDANPNLAAVTASVFGWGSVFREAEAKGYVVKQRVELGRTERSNPQLLQRWVSPRYA
jgi:hypothetical protein